MYARETSEAQRELKRLRASLSLSLGVALATAEVPPKFLGSWAQLCAWQLGVWARRGSARMSREFGMDFVMNRLMRWSGSTWSSSFSGLDPHNVSLQFIAAAVKDVGGQQLAWTNSAAFELKRIPRSVILGQTCSGDVFGDITMLLPDSMRK